MERADTGIRGKEGGRGAEAAGETGGEVVRGGGVGGVGGVGEVGAVGEVGEVGLVVGGEERGEDPEVQSKEECSCTVYQDSRQTEEKMRHQTETLPI